MKNSIIVKKARTHNLKNVDLELPKNQLCVFTGISGSGKSSMAFDTLFYEGQRRYVESLSTHAKRSMESMEKPEVDSILGLPPTIAIEQKSVGKNPRSTVGTLTELYDYFRVLFARLAQPHCPLTHQALSSQSYEEILSQIEKDYLKTKQIILAPLLQNRKSSFEEEFEDLLRKGYTRARVDGKLENLQDPPKLDPKTGHNLDLVIDRLSIEKEDSRLKEALKNALQLGKGTLILWDQKTEKLFSTFAYSKETGESYPPLEPHDFSFNSPLGMCEHCHGLGEALEWNLEEIIDPDKSIAQDTCKIATSYQTVRYKNIYDNLARIYNFSVNTPWKKLPEEAKQIFLKGAERRWITMKFVHPVTKKRWVDRVRWTGVLHEAWERLQNYKTDKAKEALSQYLQQGPCSSCQGSRIKPYPSAARIGGKQIAELCEMSIDELETFFNKLSFKKEKQIIAKGLLKEIHERLIFLKDVGLGYLSLNRTAPTLSGGEAQRVRLAAQIGCGLIGVFYILDEPSIGLHTRDNRKLIHTLRALQEKGNTVLVVEHDQETIESADHVVDFGPQAGKVGGEVIFSGDAQELLTCKGSLTAEYLSGRKKITRPSSTLALKDRPNEKLTLEGISYRNLDKLSVSFPLGQMIGLTGVSGSGKSTLMMDILLPALKDPQNPKHLKKIKGLEHIDHVICMDQTPIGRLPRSNPATYIKLWDLIRDLFSELPQSKARGFKPGRFSFNVKEGSCQHCQGMGQIKVDMDFLEDEYHLCPTCHGLRFDEATLSITYKNKNIAQVLAMSVDEACEFFKNQPAIMRKLSLLAKVGLGYICLGQASPQLSGGEAQRIKLAKELSKASKGHTLYLLDEPTTGLHLHDMQGLLNVLHALVEKGNTVLVIEHNLDLLETCDHLIDLGPEGGPLGGKVVGVGSPKAIAKLNTPTGKALKEQLAKEKKTPQKTAIKRAPLKEPEHILIQDAYQHNLKNINVEIPRGKLTLCTGPSGSGKSSLAFDTLYAEGQRRYVESLAPYARAFVKQSPKPKVGKVEALSPAISVEQKAHAGNPRSTVGTLTEIHDFFRVLYAKEGQAYCPESLEPIESISLDYVKKDLSKLNEGHKIQIFAPVSIKGQGIKACARQLLEQGYAKLRFNGEVVDLDQNFIADLNEKQSAKLEVLIDRLKIGKSHERLWQALEEAAKFGDDQFCVLDEEKERYYNLRFSVLKTGRSYPPLSPQSFAFNTKEGQCPECLGIGSTLGIPTEKLIKNYKGSLLNFFKDLWGSFPKQLEPVFNALLKKWDCSLKTAVKDLQGPALSWLLQGSPEELLVDKLTLRWKGLNATLTHLSKQAPANLRLKLSAHIDPICCPSCLGSRLHPLASHVKLHKRSLHELCSLPTSDLLTFMNALELKNPGKVILEVIAQIKSRLKFLCEVGLSHLSLDRGAPTLSNGEFQRIRLATQLGNELTGVLYVLDEPSTGLHPYDCELLGKAIEGLKKLGNTLVIVEHDPQIIPLADHVIDFGPGSGYLGGEIVATGSLEQIKKNKQSLTGQYLSQKKSIPIPQKRREAKGNFLEVKNAHYHNLKHIDVQIPIGCMTGISGISGSGKSTLLENCLLPALAKKKKANRCKLDGCEVVGLSHFDTWVYVDQKPVGHTARSDVASYLDIAPKLRTIFASTNAAKVHGLKGGDFSPNVKAGMCQSCFGYGYKVIDLRFMPPVRIPCPSCEGKRLNSLSLSVKYRGKDMGDVLEMTVLEAGEFFSAHKQLKQYLNLLDELGLGYLKLGQEIATLSGGESQRIKLAKELKKRSNTPCLYLLDEPTAGLHFSDIEKLLKIFHKLVDQGHTLLIIEHQLDVLKNCDWLIDLGPYCGDQGGELMACGPYDDVLKNKKSLTAKFLRAQIS